MTPMTLFEYFLACAGGVLALGGAALVIVCLFFVLLGWSRRAPALPPAE